MTDHEIDLIAESIVLKLDDFGRGVNNYEYGLPIFNDDHLEEMKDIVAKEIFSQLNQQQNEKTRH